MVKSGKCCSGLHRQRRRKKMQFLLICTVIILASKAEASTNKGEVKEDGNKILYESVTEAKYKVDTAYTEARKKMKNLRQKRSLTVSEIFAMLREPIARSRSAVRAAEYLEVTLKVVTEKMKCKYPEPFNISDVLTPKQKEILNQLTGCAYMYLPKICPCDRYRTINGECNNRQFPYYGASNTPLMRLLEQQYENGFDSPKGWTEDRPVNNFPLPSARLVSNIIVRYIGQPIEDTKLSYMFVHFGQFLDHDMTLSPDSASKSAFFEGVDCDTSCVKAEPCFPIKIPPNDPTIKNQSDCIPVYRSAPACNLVSPIREQINVLTSFIEGSQIYGSDKDVADKLRNFTSDEGLLNVNQNYTDKGKHFLPFSNPDGDLCLLANMSAGKPCFFAGDIRVSEQLGLSAIQTMHLREHNRVASELKKLNPHWSGETLYYEARKVIGARIQITAYEKWLPHLLGSKMSKLIPKYTCYNDQVNPSVSQAFTIAFRVGHTMVLPFMYLQGEGYKPHHIEPILPFHETFFSSWRMLRDGIAPYVRGLLMHYAKLNLQDQIVDNELRENLYKPVKRIGLDLPAINIQRGRDRGLPGYTAYRKFCGLSVPENLDELAIVLNNRPLAEKFMELYHTTHNIDLWVGAVAETKVEGGRAGEVLCCLIADQFRRLRDGDRFFYENKCIFTSAQLSSLRNASMSQIICDNTEIATVPEDVFLGNGDPEKYTPCSEIPPLDLSPWKEDPSQPKTGTEPGRGSESESECGCESKCECTSGCGCGTKSKSGCKCGFDDIS